MELVVYCELAESTQGYLSRDPANKIFINNDF